MKNKHTILRILMLLLLLISGLSLSGCQTTPDTRLEVEASNEEIITEENNVIEDSVTEEDSDQVDVPTSLEENTPIIRDIYTADPSAHVFNGSIYIYPSHDPDEMADPSASSDDGGHYQMVDYHVLSIDSFDGTATDHGVALALEDIPWASTMLWAPDAAVKDDIYYFYFPAKDVDGIFRIGLARGSNPEGPFTPEDSYIEGSYSIDPAVFVDTDDQAYMVFGGIWGGQLERWSTGEYIENPIAPSGNEPALGPVIARMSEDMLSFASEPQEISIIDTAGNPITANDESRRFFEAAWIHKYQDTYYLSYSTGSTHYIVYATSDQIEGPYTYQGQLLTPVLGWTSHHSIVEFEDQWYMFYHDASLSGGIDHKRSVKYTEIIYNEDGTIQTIHY